MVRVTRKNTYVLVFAALSAALILPATGCTEGASEEASRSEQSAERRPTAVRVQEPERRSLEKRMSYVGTVFSTREVKVISRVQGTLSEQEFEEGETFSEDALLARLESPEIEASVERVKAERDYWCRKHETDKRLVEQGALAPEQAGASERACRSARASLAEAEAQLEKTRVSAPFAGEVLDWLAEPGQPLMPGKPIVLIGDPAREVRVDVVEEDLTRGVTVGTAAEMQLDAETTVESSVTKVSSVSSGPARTFSVTAPLPPAVAGELRQGASIRVDFILEREENTLAVPSRALASGTEGPAVFVIRDGVARRQPVTTGVSESGWTAVEFDWNGSDPIAITNIQSLRNGAAVFAVREEGQAQ